MNHVPAALRAHDRHDSLACEERRAQVHRHQPVELLVRELSEGLAGADAGVVHQDVDAAHALVGRGNHGFRLARAREVVHAPRGIRGAGLAAGRRGVLELPLGAVCSEIDRCPFRGEPQRDRAADAA